MSLQIRLIKDPCSYGVQMVFHERNFDDKVVAIGKLTMESFEPRTVIPPEARVDIEDTTAQVLMDDLWKCGYRPTEGKGSAGALLATEKHLQDMRTLVSKGMEVDLNG